MFRSMNKMYYRGVNGVILVCDMFERKSFDDLTIWLTEFLDKQDKTSDYTDFAYVLLGNKIDLVWEPVLTDIDLRDWCEKQIE